MAALDLGDIDPKRDAERGSAYHVLDPRTGRPLYADDEMKEPCRLFLLGTLADRVEAKLAEITKRREDREAKRFEEIKAKDPKKSDEEARKEAESTPEEKAEDDAELMAAATTGWENLSYKGKTKYNPAVGKQMYLDRPWLRVQVLRWVLNPANFIQGRAKA